MADSVQSNGRSTVRLTGIKALDLYGAVLPVLIDYVYNGAKFFVLVSTWEEHLPPGYDLEQSTEGKLLVRMSDLTWGEFDEEKDKLMDAIEDELAQIALEACLPLIQELGPATPLPESRTMQEQLYPPFHTLQILTEGEKLIGRKLDGYEVPEKYTPVLASNLQGMETQNDIPTIDCSEIIPKERLKNLVWRVVVNGEEMVCKISSSIFDKAIEEEINAYLRIRSAHGLEDLMIPSFKGIVKSHRGIIGLLLGYIPHKHPSLRVILDCVKDGSLPETEASSALRKKWADQIKNSLDELHKLDILWRDIKTDNVLIDVNGDAFLIDLGGGNTVSWVDRDKYGTMEGEAQGLSKLLKALGQEG